MCDNECTMQVGICAVHDEACMMHDEACVVHVGVVMGDVVGGVHDAINGACVVHVGGNVKRGCGRWGLGMWREQLSAGERRLERMEH